jgi:sugar O-acyltransferase (sialic acid O-acetyltransferase NeuD family)
MTDRLIILGSGGMAHDVMDVVHACNAVSARWQIVGCLDDFHPRGSRLGELEVLGTLADAKQFAGCKFILAIGSDKSFASREALLAKTALARDEFATLVHPAASVSPLAQIGQGVCLGHGVAVGAGVSVGDHVVLSMGSLIGHDCRVGPYTVVAPGACISGFVTIGPSCYIGAHASIRQYVQIGHTALVGMGAVVLEDIAPKAVVVGNPARPLLRPRDGASDQFPRVDVIVPCYKYAHYLRGCVESALNQQGVDVRVLILDDASPDDTPAVAADLARRDPRVEFRRHVVNRGHIATFNEGLDWASGQYLVLLSADDLLLPGALRRAVAVMETHPNVGFVHGQAVVCEDPQSATERIHEGPEYQLVHGETFLDTAFCYGLNMVQTPTVVARTRLQKQIGGYRPELLHTGDMEMWMRFAVHGDVAVLAAHQAYYRIHGKNMSSQYRTISDLQMRFKAFEVIFREYSDKIADASRRRQEVVQLLSREVFYLANEAFDRGELADCRLGIEAARQINPAIAQSRAYRRLGLKKRLGPRLWSLLRVVARKMAKPIPVPL